MTTRESEPRTRSPYVDDFEAEEEVDFGRYWRAVVQRWWLLLLGLVLGAVIGFAVSVGGSRPYVGRTAVYLGQPFAPGGTNQIQSLPTRFGFVDQLVHSVAVTRRVAAEVGIRRADLARNIATDNISGVSKGQNELLAPLVAVEVQNPSAKKANAASDALGKALVDFFSRYSRTKLNVYLTRQKNLVTKENIASSKLAFLQKQY